MPRRLDRPEQLRRFGANLNLRAVIERAPLSSLYGEAKRSETRCISRTRLGAVARAAAKVGGVRPLGLARTLFEHLEEAIFAGWRRRCGQERSDDSGLEARCDNRPCTGAREAMRDNVSSMV